MTNTQIDLKINDLKLNGKYWLFERALKDVTLELRIDIDNRLPYIVYGARQIDMTRERLRYLLAELALNRMELMDRDFDEVVSNFLGEIPYEKINDLDYTADLFLYDLEKALGFDLKLETDHHLRKAIIDFLLTAVRFVPYTTDSHYKDIVEELIDTIWEERVTE